jgi:hypothetical protein
MQIVIKIIVCVPPSFIWHVAQIVVDVISLIIIARLFNQSNEQWLLSDVLHSIITMNTKLMEEL